MGNSNRGSDNTKLNFLSIYPENICAADCLRVVASALSTRMLAFNNLSELKPCVRST